VQRRQGMGPFPTDPTTDLPGGRSFGRSSMRKLLWLMPWGCALDGLSYLLIAHQARN
jgi:hypothetical protein